MATGSVAGSQRFKISIKSAEEVQGQQKGDLGALRAAAQVRGWGAAPAAVCTSQAEVALGCCMAVASKQDGWHVQTSRLFLNAG